jgi:hypothetical protein
VCGVLSSKGLIVSDTADDQLGRESRQDIACIASTKQALNAE